MEEPREIAIVAGGAGFIGQHLCKSLLGSGKIVACLDNFMCGNKNVKEDLGNPDDLYVFDVDINYLDEVFNVALKEMSLLGNISEFYNLACPASPVQYKENPINTLYTNVHGTKVLLNFAYYYNAAFFQASTSEIYGDPLEYPQKETYNGNVSTIGERACYDEGKRCAETFCDLYHKRTGIPVRIGRIFNTYGPLMQVNDGRVISNFIVNALRGDDIVIYGDGTRTRSFCYIDDLIDGINGLMSVEDKFVLANVGNDQYEFTIYSLAFLIREMTNSESKIIFSNETPDDPHIRKPDLTRIKSLCNFNPKVSIEEGLMKTIEYFRGIINE